MICYYFPPLQDVGARRSIAFAKYLRRHSWNCRVVSVKNPDKNYCSLGKEEPPEGVQTEYSKSILNLSGIIGNLDAIVLRILKIAGIVPKFRLFYNLICIPDLFIGWIPLTVLKCLRLFKKTNFDIIYVSCSPFSSALIGIALKAFTKKTLAIDFRDPFTINTPLNQGLLKSRIKINRMFESYFIKKADIFIVNTDDTKEAYETEFPHSRNKIFAIHNGFDADYKIDKNNREKFEKFTIIYSGDFYFYSQPFIDPFFAGCKLLKTKETINRYNFQFLFYGDGAYKINELSARYGVQDLVSSHQRVPYENLLISLSKSHLQLLRIVKGFLSTKLFEGIPLNVPFLATIPHGEAERIIKEFSPGSYIVTEEKPDVVAQAITDAMQAYKINGIPDNLIDRFLSRFSRENLTLKLIDIMEAKLNTLDTLKV